METITQTQALEATSTSTTTTFEVFAYPAFFQGSPVDHVYVKFADGTTFPCAGGDTGGTALKGTSGAECLDTAKKLNASMSLPIKVPVPFLGDKTIFSIPTGDTGIIYAVNGVCHMMADRIMAPSKVTVENARGFALSSGLFGVYGVYVPYSMDSVIERLLNTVLGSLPGWAKTALETLLKTICPGSIVNAFATLLQKGAQSEWRARLKANGMEPAGYLKAAMAPSLCDKLDSIYSEENLMRLTDDLPEQEHEIVVRHLLESDIDEETMQKLQQCMKDLRAPAPTTSVLKGMSGPKSTEELMNEMNNRSNNFLSKANQILGDEKFEKLYKLEPGERVELFDPKEFDAMLKNIADSLKDQFKDQ